MTAKREVQVSAPVSIAVREELERYVRATGVKKGHLIQEALRHHLQALRELPSDVIVHPHVVVTRESGEAILRSIRRAPRPTAALRKLMRDGD